ncbi:hypothetical protein JYT44_01830 [Caldithrix abyssi]|nr:hypothetical protein [Caldithrix abyssi]
MRHLKLLTVFIFSGTFLVCCSSWMAASKPAMEYRLSAGVTTLDDFLTLTPRILNDYRYFEDRRENRGVSWTIETQWLFRNLSDEERSKGVVDGRYRLIVECRLKAGGVGSYNVKVIAQNFIRYSGNDDWLGAPLPEKEKLAIKRFTNALKNEYENKIRAF